jgi:hypothetical protein
MVLRNMNTAHGVRPGELVLRTVASMGSRALITKGSMGAPTSGGSTGSADDVCSALRVFIWDSLHEVADMCTTGDVHLKKTDSEVVKYRGGWLLWRQLTSLGGS